jgi:hypothetical protein
MNGADAHFGCHWSICGYDRWSSLSSNIGQNLLALGVIFGLGNQVFVT